VHPQIARLLELQKVDQELAALRKDLDSLPFEEQKRLRRLEELERVRSERKEAAVRAELEARAQEKSIKQGDDEIKKLTERLNAVRNNAEYQATLFQIESVKRERDETQERCLELLDQLEALKLQAEQSAAAVAAERAVFEEFQSEAQKLRSHRDAEVAAVQARRDAMAEGIPPELLSDYDRLLRLRGGLAVALVERKSCQGCFTTITTNDEARLRGGSGIIHCGSCQRILYLAG
jgi:predicted  nucleic acid-binding Zn-ribbon protein